MSWTAINLLVIKPVRILSFINNSQQELEHNEQILSGKRPERPQEQEQNAPAGEPEPFTPKLPVEYADLTVEEEPMAAEPVKEAAAVRRTGADLCGLRADSVGRHWLFRLDLCR